MIPTKNSDIKVQNHMDGQKVAMQFDANSLVHIMSILTDLYSDPEMAVIREYSTNALDSHIAANNSRPIEITLPGSLSPFFKVKDYGVGMSVSDIESIYSKYGASTKRATDDQVGMLGLGCKSALTYVNQFTVTAIKGGVKTQVSVGRNEDGSGTMEIVDTVSTNEPNGVQITVPVRNINSFNIKADKFFSFWDKGSVLVDGKEPNLVGLTKVTEDIFINQDFNDATDYIVMGNVAYPLSYPNIITSNYYGVVARVPIGSVHFTPSREALHYTSTTLTTIARIKSELAENFDAAVTKDIEGSASHAVAIKNTLDWSRRLRKQLSIQYKGLDVPTEFCFSDNKMLPKTGYVYRPNQYRRSVCSESRFPAGEIFRGVVVVTGHTKAVSAAYKAKVKLWAENSGITAKSFIFVENDFGMPWTADVTKVTSEEIKKVVLPASTARNYGASKNIPGSFLVWNGTGWTERNDLKATDDLVYVSHVNRDNYTNALKFLSGEGINFPVVALPINREKKFLREFPKVRTLSEVLVPTFKKISNAVTDQDRASYGVDHNIGRYIERLDLSKIDDPAFKVYADLVKHQNESKTIALWKRCESIVRYTNVRMDSPLVNLNGPIESPFDKYPLLTEALNTSYNSRRVLDSTDLYVYLNAAYAAKKDGK